MAVVFAAFSMGGRLLLNRARDMQNEDGWTPLHEACCLGNAEIAKVLLRHGADAQARCKDGTTPLHKAARAGNAAVIALLLQAGADDSAVDKVGAICWSFISWRGPMSSDHLIQTAHAIFCENMPDVYQDMVCASLHRHLCKHDTAFSAPHLQHGLEPMDCAVDAAVAKLLSEGLDCLHSAAPFNAPSFDSGLPRMPASPRTPRTPKQARRHVCA